MVEKFKMFSLQKNIGKPNKVSYSVVLIYGYNMFNTLRHYGYKALPIITNEKVRYNLI
jgi:hypothetical protein